MNLAIGESYEVVFPFIVEAVHSHMLGEYSADESWVPGCRDEEMPPGDWTEKVADGEGKMVLTIVDIHKPGKYPERVFYTRKWIDPDGDEFGAKKLHITTTPTFRRRATGYYHKYRIEP
ncbi:MAG: hypothetical protein RPU52_02430 [Candidatus Sedimenticola sp. (ex Thyasira tokunagai)]